MKMKNEIKTPPVVSLGMSLQTFLKGPLTVKNWVSNIEARRLQIGKMLDQITLPTIDRLLLPGASDITRFGDKHPIGEDDPKFVAGSDLFDSMYKNQVLEIVRNDVSRIKEWPNGHDQLNVVALNRHDGEWVIIEVKYQQEPAGYKRALVVRAQELAITDILRLFSNKSPTSIWLGLRVAFKIHCDRKRKQMQAFKEIEDWFDVESIVYCAHQEAVAQLPV